MIFFVPASGRNPAKLAKKTPLFRTQIPPFDGSKCPISFCSFEIYSLPFGFNTRAHIHTSEKKGRKKNSYERCATRNIFFRFRGVEIAVNFYSPSSNEILRPVMFSTAISNAPILKKKRKTFVPIVFVNQFLHDFFFVLFDNDTTYIYRGGRR